MNRTSRVRGTIQGHRGFAPLAVRRPRPSGLSSRPLIALPPCSWRSWRSRRASGLALEWLITSNACLSLALGIRASGRLVLVRLNYMQQPFRRDFHRCLMHFLIVIEASLNFRPRLLDARQAISIRTAQSPQPSSPRLVLWGRTLVFSQSVFMGLMGITAD